MSIGESNRGGGVRPCARLWYAHVCREPRPLARLNSSATKQVHNGHNNIISYPLESDDKITFSRDVPRDVLRLWAALEVSLPWRVNCMASLPPATCRACAACVQS